MIFGMIFKILHEMGNLGIFDCFPTHGTFMVLDMVSRKP